MPLTLKGHLDLRSPVDDAASSVAPIDILARSEEALQVWRGALASLFAIDARDGIDVMPGDATFTMHHVGCFLVGSMSAPPSVLRRGCDLVAAVGIDHILLQLFVSGEARFEAEHRTGNVRAGDILCLDLSRQMRMEGSALSIINLVVPRRRIRLPPRRLLQTHGVVIGGGGAVGLMLVKQLATIVDVAPNLSAHDVDLAAELVSTLASVGLVAATGPEAAAEAPAAQTSSPVLVAPSLQVILSHINQNLASLTLAPDRIGRQFGLSRSSLYRLFEPLGGIADYIRERRIERAALHLTSVGHGRGAVARLAVLCGFSSEAAFSRAFRQRFAMTPKDAIAAALDRTAQAPTADPGDVLHGWLKALAG